MGTGFFCVVTPASVPASVPASGRSVAEDCEDALVDGAALDGAGGGPASGGSGGDIVKQTVGVL